MKHMLLIINPMSGQRRANRMLTEIIGLFNQHGYMVSVFATRGRGDAIGIVAEQAYGMDLVVAIGGDGTFNETLTGLRWAGLDIPLGYIPSGSTNDYANSLHLPLNIMDAAKAIMEGKPRAYDVGRFGDRNFSYVASFGIFTKTSYSTPQSMKNALGHLAYLLAGVKELTQIASYHLKLETEMETIEGDYLFGAISNSTSVGGILNLDPSVVDMADGVFEVLLIRAPRNAMELAECLFCLSNQRYNCAMMTFLASSRIRITADPDMPWTLDGERAEGQEVVTVENIHLGLRIIQMPEED